MDGVIPWESLTWGQILRELDEDLNTWEWIDELPWVHVEAILKLSKVH